MSKLYRSRRDKKITGLCGGLSDFLNIDATLLRLIIVVAAFISGGTVILLYFVASIVIPKEPYYHDHHDQFGGYRGTYAGNGGNQYKGSFYQGGSTGGMGSSAGNYSSDSYKQSQSSNIDEMMKDIEKKAMQKEIEELRVRLAQLEKNKNNQDKGEV